MKPCPSCGRSNAPEHRFCQQCGHPLGDMADANENQTILATAPLAAPPRSQRGEPRAAVPLDKLFAGKARIVVGRAPDCDVVLPHPTVSRHHAAIDKLPDGGLRVSDLESSNGIFIDGQRMEGPHLVRERQRVGIGPMLFSLEKGVVYSFDSSRSLRLQARGVEKVVTKEDGGTLKLLADVHLTVEPGEFVTLLGPSGSGKSTLMDCLNGRRRATGGRVLANGEDFYRHFDSFRQSLGYVPQKDIVHSHLSVARALYYTAKLRLPTDTSPNELRNRVEEVLHAMELTTPKEDHRHKRIGTLSGGQIKRVSLGAELLAQPYLLFIDEATSGLDAGTDAKMMKLFRRLAEEGKSILCITHNVENVEHCHKVLVLCRGRLVFFGPPEDAPAYFGVRRLSEIYDRLQESDREPEVWEKDFKDSKYHAEYVEKRLKADPFQAPVPPPAPANGGSAEDAERVTVMAASPPSHSALVVAAQPVAVPRPRHPPLWHQFRVLTTRYVELLWRDRPTLRLLFWQAPAVGLLLLVGFLGLSFQDKIPATKRVDADQKKQLEDGLEFVQSQKDNPNLTKQQQQQLGQLNITMDTMVKAAEKELPIIPYGEIVNPKYSYMLLTILAIAVFWLGCNNAAKEIAKEEAIYARERAVNLGILPYLGSKFLVLSAISAVQVLLLMTVIYGLLHLWHWTAGAVVPQQYCLDYLPQYGVLVLLAMAGVAMGLLLSACVSSPDQASVLLPYVLIPQIVLVGSMIPVDKGAAKYLAVTLSPVYWAYRAIHQGASQLPEGFPARVVYDDVVGDSALGACLVMAVQTLALLLMTAWFLRRKDAGSEQSDWLSILAKQLAGWFRWRKEPVRA